jgi:hypothetical protein
MPPAEMHGRYGPPTPEAFAGKAIAVHVRKTIQVAGIGSMVYAFLVVTPMHNLLVGVALLFFVTAMLATLHMLYVERHRAMFLAGLVCLAVTLSNAAMYYGNVDVGLLPIVQKVSLVMWVGWLLALHFAEGC